MSLLGLQLCVCIENACVFFPKFFLPGACLLKCYLADKIFLTSTGLITLCIVFWLDVVTKHYTPGSRDKIIDVI